MGRTSLTAKELGIAIDGAALALNVDGATRSADAVRYAHEDGALECDVYAPPYADKSATGSTVEPDNTVPKPLRGLTVHGAAGGVGPGNISGYFEHALDEAYWNRVSTAYVTRTADGWAHVSMDNTSGSSSIYTYCRAVKADLEPSSTYTLLLEFANVVASGVVEFRPNRSNAAAAMPQFSDNLGIKPMETTSYKLTSFDGFDDSVCLNDTYITCQPGAALECDIRMSLYHGDYGGPHMTEGQMMLGGAGWTPIDMMGCILGEGDHLDVQADGTATATVGGAVTSLPDVDMPTVKAGDVLSVQAGRPVEITATWADTEREDA